MATASGPVARIAVLFVQPQHFTDVRYAKAEPNSVALLGELHTFMCKMGERYVPVDMQLEITVADIDLAGDFEPWRGPQFGHIRITRDIDPPHISLEFRLTDSSSSVVSAGQRMISAIDYQEWFVRLSGDYLRYEKALLHAWFRNEFGAIKPSPTLVRSGGLP
jgi:hypothetical protein